MQSIIDIVLSPAFFITVFAVFVIKKGIYFVPQNTGFVVYRFGKYTKTLGSGLNYIVPFVDSVQSEVSLKEETISIPMQSATTKDNITITVDGVIFYKVLDAASAINNVGNYQAAISQLAMTAMRNTIGSMELDDCFQQRNTINAKIGEAMSGPTQAWGATVLRVEISDIIMPESIREDMEKQMTAERQKRSTVLTAEGIKSAAILQAEGAKQAAILNAEAQKAKEVLAAEGNKESQILEAEGKAKAIELVAEAEANAITKIGSVMENGNGKLATNYKLTQDAIAAHANIAKEGTIVITDGNTGESISKTVAQAIAVSSSVNKVV